MTESAEALSPEPAPPKPTFDALPLTDEVRRAIDGLGYTHPTPVQLAVFEPASRGKSLVVQARTGTGKTAAFGLPIVDQLVRRSDAKTQALILTPTRELAIQVATELGRIASHKGLTVEPIYGGAPMGAQIAKLEKGVHIVAGTPGRVLDHLRRGTLDASAIRIFVLDEADEMLSMGFAKELNAIIGMLPSERQGLYFSATIPPDVERLASSHLSEPEWLTLSSDQVGALSISHFVYIARGDKRAELIRILEVENPESAVIFCNTKDETQRVAEALRTAGYDADWLNGDLDQRERERVMKRTKEGQLRFLVATDVAARGIDISHLTHVINADFPESAEQYVHRTGRTGRAGRTGTAISLVGPKDVGHLYMLRLTYKIRPVERAVPSAGEMKTRAETDMVAFFADGYGTRAVTADDLALARRLLTHESAERIVAALLREHLGAREDEVKTQASEARRAKNPPPVEEEVPALAVAPVSAEEKPRARPARRREGDTSEERPARDRGRDPSGSSRARGARRAPRHDQDDVASASAVPEAPPLPRIHVEGDGEASEPSREDRAPEDPSVANVFLNVGRRDGLRAGDLSLLLAELAGLSEEEISRVRLRDRISFVSVARDRVDDALAAWAGQTIAGRTLVAEIARDKP